MGHGFHGIVPGEGVHFGMALWPYDLLLRFGYDLPENEHTWDGKWFDDAFEAAAFDLRSTAAKLMLCLRTVAAEAAKLREVTDGDIRPRELEAASALAERAPMGLDLAFSYLRRIGRDIATVIPCCYALEGRALLPDRQGMRRLRESTALAGIDAGLPGLLAQAPVALLKDGAPSTHTPTLYVVADARGFRSALPKAAARGVRESCRQSLAAGEQLCEATNAVAAWLDRLLAYLQGVVAARSEPGEELRERWSVRDWSLLSPLGAGDEALAGYWPELG
ncbi:MAG: hypothetical protein ACKVT1_09380 [Dehalococcoidia bacterium]